MDARAFVQAVADKARGAPPIVYEEEFGAYTLTWEGERLSCGVTAGATGACVFLADVGMPAEEGAGPEWAVETVDDAPAAGWGEPIVR